jgi:CDGSH-type Zn-finger protein
MSENAPVKITIYDDGPIEIEGAVSVVDENGKAIEVDISDSIFLCRCGASGDKPFCDGSHHDCSFKHKISA